MKKLAPNFNPSENRIRQGLTVEEFAFDQMDSTDGIEGTDDFSEPIEFNEAKVAVLVRVVLATGLTGFEGQSILSLHWSLVTHFLA